MASLLNYRRQALREPPYIGEVHSAASGTATTAVVNALISALPTAHYERWWLIRAAAAAAADIDRQVTTFAGSTGTLTHNQTNYTNNPAAAEVIELVQEAFPRWRLDDAVNWALHNLKKEHSDIIPLRYGINRYPLRAWFPWILEPSSVASVAYRNSPVLSRNRYMQGWNGVSAANVDSYTLAGGGATLARITSSPTPNKGEYAASLTRVTNNVTLTQTVLQFHRNDWMEGRTLLVVMVGYSATASILRASIGDGVTTANTSLHTGGSTFERLTQTIVIDSSAPTILTIAGQINTTDGVGVISQLYVADATAITDELEEDAYPEYTMEYGKDYWFDQGDMALMLPRSYGVPGQLVIKSYRPYLLETERLSTQTDTADAPLEEVAYGVLAHALSQAGHEGAPAAMVNFKRFMHQHVYEGRTPPSLISRAPGFRRI